MPEGTSPDATSQALTVEQAASLFESMDSPEGEDTSADETQQDTVDSDQPEQIEDDDVEGTDEDAANNDDLGENDEEEGDPEDAEPVRTLKVKLPEGVQELPEDEVIKGYLRQ